ncbi:MAG: hypothetical protein J6X03_00925 [Bacilli bacterium]|nr:hypothetical protein [Bacilli bacterium]
MHKTIYDLLKTLNIPVAYDHFSSDKYIEPPFLAYREIAADTFKADNITYIKENNFEIELVTSKKDVALQKTIEDLLTENKIPYDVGDEVWDSDEKIYHNYYEI